MDVSKKPPAALRELCWAVFVSIAAVLFAVNTDTIPDGSVIFGISLDTPCAYKMFFGVPCPSCGLTRALIEGFHFHFVDSWNYHWAGLWITFGVLILIIWRLRRFVVIKQRRYIQFQTEKVLWGKIGLLYVFGFAILTVGNWFYHLSQLTTL